MAESISSYSSIGPRLWKGIILDGVHQDLSFSSMKKIRVINGISLNHHFEPPDFDQMDYTDAATVFDIKLLKHYYFYYCYLSEQVA